MSGYTLTPLAQEDVDGIWDYTQRNWGDRQAVAYIRNIRDACRDLADGTRIGRSIGIRAGYRRHPVGSHVIFYKDAGGGDIVIVRILHSRMDVGRHL